jgi:hypothetical protein
MDRTRSNLTADDAQRVANALDRHGVDGMPRRAFLGAAAASVAGAAALSFPGLANAQGSAADIGAAAVTAEALAVTYLTGVIAKTGSQWPKQVQNVLKAANAAEQAHYEALRSLGFKPLTTRFWVPDLAFEAAAIPPVIEYLESAFVNAYLIATTAFAKAGQADHARYAVEIGAVEAEHLALIRSVEKKLPDDRAFQAYNVASIDAIVRQITATGVGLGKRGAGPGRFYEYRKPPASAVTGISHTTPA